MKLLVTVFIYFFFTGCDAAAGAPQLVYDSTNLNTTGPGLNSFFINTATNVPTCSGAVLQPAFPGSLKEIRMIIHNKDNVPLNVTCYIFDLGTASIPAGQFILTSPPIAQQEISVSPGLGQTRIFYFTVPYVTVDPSHIYFIGFSASSVLVYTTIYSCSPCVSPVIGTYTKSFIQGTASCDTLGSIVQDGSTYAFAIVAGSDLPTASPTEAPTQAPTVSPTTAPTETPTVAPTVEPTEAPTSAPTTSPTEAPSAAPTTEPTGAPSNAPTPAPTSAPTTSPTVAPTVEPTVAPTEAPTEAPSGLPLGAIIGIAIGGGLVAILVVLAIGLLIYKIVSANEGAERV